MKLVNTTIEMKPRTWCSAIGLYVFGQEERIVEAHVDSGLITLVVFDRIDDGDWTQQIDVVVGADALDAVDVLLLFPPGSVTT